MNEELKQKIEDLARHISVLREDEIKAENIEGGFYIAKEDVIALIESIVKPKKWF